MNEYLKVTITRRFRGGIWVCQVREQGFLLAEEGWNEIEDALAWVQRILQRSNELPIIENGD